MGLLSMIFLGFVAGGIAGWLTGKRAGGCVSRIVVGVVGAVLGGAIARAAGYRGLGNELSLRALGVAVLGTCVLLLLLQALEGRRS